MLPGPKWLIPTLWLYIRMDAPMTLDLCHEHPLIYQRVTAVDGPWSQAHFKLIGFYSMNIHYSYIYIFVLYVCRSPTYSDLATRAVSLLSQIWPKSEALIKLLSYFLWFWPPDLALFVGYDLLKVPVKPLLLCTTMNLYVWASPGVWRDAVFLLGAIYTPVSKVHPTPPSKWPWKSLKLIELWSCRDIISLSIQHSSIGIISTFCQQAIGSIGLEFQEYLLLARKWKSPRNTSSEMLTWVTRPDLARFTMFIFVAPGWLTWQNAWNSSIQRQ